jgi:transcriptional antiterminator NusG
MTKKEEEKKIDPSQEIESTDDQEKPEMKDRVLKQSGERNWYVIHTYAGYEEQVAENLKQRIESLGMNDRIFDVIVPKEKQIEIKNGKRKTVEKRIFPGYVMVDMIVTDDTWYVVRNTPNVTGFIGFGVRPTPMSKPEIDRIRKRMGVEEPKYKIELKEGELVRITDGALKGFEGKVEEVDQDRGKIKVSVNMFGRETPVNLDFLQVKKI